MNTKFVAAAQAIAEHFKAAEARRGEPFAETFIDPMNNDAVTPSSAGIPVALLRALVEAPEPSKTPLHDLALLEFHKQHHPMLLWQGLVRQVETELTNLKAEHARIQIREWAKVSGAVTALSELVRLKDLKDRLETREFSGPFISKMTDAEFASGKADYAANKDTAWAAARAAAGMASRPAPAFDPYSGRN